MKQLTGCMSLGRTNRMVCYSNNFNVVLTLRSMIFDHYSFHEDNSFSIYCLKKMTIPKVTNRVHELRVLLSRGSFRGARPLFRFFIFFYMKSSQWSPVFRWQFRVRMTKEQPRVTAQLKKFWHKSSQSKNRSNILNDPVKTPSISSIYIYNHLPPLPAY